MKYLKFLKFFNKFIFPVLISILVFLILKISGLMIYFACLFVYFCWKRRKKFFAYFGTISNIRGNQVNSAKWFYRAYMTDKTDNLIATDAAYTCLRLGDLKKAEQILKNVDLATLDGEAKVKAANNISILYWKTGDLPNAILTLESLYHANVKSTSLFGNLTYYYILNGDSDKALALAKEAYEYNSSDIVIIENLARISHITGDWDEATTHYAKLEQLSPTYPEAWVHLASFLEDSKQFEAAKEALNKALKCNFSFLSNVTKDQIESKLKSISTVPALEAEH